MSSILSILLGEPSGSPGNCRRTGSYKATNYWEEQRWQLNGMNLNGYYRTYYGSYKGTIDLFESGDHQFYIHNPPQQLRRHSHWPCFMFRGNGLYWVHFRIKPKNVDAGIITIERIIRESMEQ
jgi:hypothetical protein